MSSCGPISSTHHNHLHATPTIFTPNYMYMIVALHTTSQAHAIANSQAHTIANSQAHTIANSQAHTIANSQAHTIANSQAHTIANSQAHTIANSQAHTIANCSFATYTVDSICTFHHPSTHINLTYVYNNIPPVTLNPSSWQYIYV